MGTGSADSRIEVYITPVGYAELHRRANRGDIDAKCAIDAFKFKVDPTLREEFGEDLAK